MVKKKIYMKNVCLLNMLILISSFDTIRFQTRNISKKRGFKEKRLSYAMWPWMTFEVILHFMTNLHLLNVIFHRNVLERKKLKSLSPGVPESRRDGIFKWDIEELTFLRKYIYKIQWLCRVSQKKKLLRIFRKA